jgi:hypothetical protein
MIRLGIVVVYLVVEGSERLLELHLRQIEKHTHVHYTIFGCASRLSSEARKMLDAHPRVRLCDCVLTTATGSEEHAHYLDQLTRIAIDSGATHVVTLHVDSFPIHSAWVERLVSRLSVRCPFATGERIDSGCMIFTRDFYLRYHPNFLPTESERSLPEYSRYVAEWELTEHSGVGYAFRAYSAGLSGDYLRLSSPGLFGYQLPAGSGGLCRIYEDLVFHLCGFQAILAPAGTSVLCRSAGPALVKFTRTLAKPLIPAWSVRAFRRRFGGITKRFVDEPLAERWRQQATQALEELLANPEGFLDSLRGVRSKSHKPGTLPYPQ